MKSTSTNKRPWNRINAPVYSLLTRNGEHWNMNIATYVTAVSMQPKRMGICVYHHTQTHVNVQKGQMLVLQLLASTQYRLVKQLGFQSGRDKDKMKPLIQRDELMQWKQYPVLKHALAVMELMPQQMMTAGDHDLWIADVISWKNLNEGIALSLDDLRARKLIRI